MKKNSFFTKKPKLGFVAFLMVFCSFFTNGVMAQGTFTWNGATSSSWTTATNWTKSGTATTSTYPGESSSTDLVVVNTTNAPNALILTSPNSFTVARVTVANNFGLASGAILTIDSGATLNITSASVSNLILNGGNIVNNGAINIATSAPGSTGFPVYGINCGTPVQLPTVATTYGISGSGTLNITLSAANLATSTAIYVSGNTSTLPIYRIATNGTITLNQASSVSISAVRPIGGATVNKLIISGAGFTVGSVGSPEAKAQLFNLGAGSDVTVDTGTTITYTSAATNANNGIISSFSTSATATNFTNKGTINIVGSTSRSGLFFSTGATANIVTYNVVNEGTLNVDLNSSGVGHAAFATGNGGGAGAAGTAVNINNSGSLTLKNTSTLVGSGFSIYGNPAGEAPPMVFTNSSTGTINLEGTIYNSGSKTSINNSGILNTNNELKSFASITNNVGGSINFTKTAATAGSRQVTFTGLTFAAAAAVGTTYTHGANTYTVITQKFTSTTAGTNLTCVVASSASVINEGGSLVKTGTGGGDTSIDFTGISIPAINIALNGTTNNSGTINTGVASDLNIISGVTAASVGTIAPGGSGKGIVDFSNASTLAINSVLKLDVSGSAVSGVDYDKITNTAVGGGFDISGATLDVTGIYSPSTYTVIDIVTVESTGTLTGTFASVIGLGSGWSVVYNSGTAGAVQLVKGTAGTPTITRLSSNGTNTITSACEGSRLIIIGTNLTGTSEIRVNGVSLTNVVDVSSTRAEGDLPIGARVGQVAVTTPGGTVTTAGNLTVVENSTVVTAITACDTYTWANNGQTYTTSGTYTGTTTSCVTQQLVLNIVTTPAPIVTTVNQCGGTYTWPSNGVTYSTSTNLNIIVGCTSETLNLTITAPTTTGSETRNECGASYTWPLSGQTYTTSGTYTHVVGCNTATLTLTLGSASTTGSETVSACGSSYTWALNGQTYNASGNYNHVVDCNTATLSLTLTPATTTGSETVSACGSSYTWALNGQTYNASGNYDHIVGCNTATLSLTLTPSTTTGSENISQCGGTYTWLVNNVTYSASETVVVTSGCNTATLNLTITAPTTNGSVTQVQTGGTYTWVANGTTYSTSGIYTHVVGCNTATLDLTINTPVSEIPENFPAFCKGATVATATGTTSLKFYTTLTGGLPLAGSTLLATGKTLFVTEMVNSVETSPRVGRLITVNVLPATPGSMTTSDAVLCKNIGTTNQVTYTVPAVAATTYNWTVPPGVNIISGAGTNALTVNFLGASTSTTVGGIGTIATRAVNSFGCISAAARSLVLTSKLPTAPASLVMTSADTVDHFNLPVIPATIPATFTLSSLSDLTKITKVGPYMGTNTVFTLTAASAPTAASYEWTLPAGVTQLSGDTSSTITVNFAGVTPAIGALPIVVKSEGGCGLSAARTLTLARALPTAPLALVLTDDAISTTTPITKVSAYTGKTTQLTLTATPVRIQGATATSYAWVLPESVNIVSPTATPTTLYQLVNQGTVLEPNMVNVPFSAWSTGTASTITIDFADAEQGELSFPLTVYAVNGAGNSKARTRTVTAAAPATPGTITTPLLAVPTFNPACPGTTSITVQVPSVFGVSYAWTVGGTEAVITAGQGTNSITIDVEAVTTATLAISVVGSNGTGNSLPRALTIKKVNTCREASTAIAKQFNVVAYPNPSSEDFNIAIESSSKAASTIKVYDMQGRLIENSKSNSNSVRVGSRYAAGAYNVIVTQGANTKSIRVIKK